MADESSSPSPSEAGKNLFLKACDGEISAIERLGVLASESCSEADMKRLLQAFIHQITTENAGESRTREQYLPTPPALAALHCIGNILTRTFYTRPHVGDIVRKLLLRPKKTWDALWRWTRLTINLHLSEPRHDVQILLALDNLYYRMLFGSQIPGHVNIDQLGSMFTRLWLLSSEFPRRTFTLPLLVVKKLFSLEDFVKETRSSPFDIADLGLEYIDLAFRLFLDGVDTYGEQLSWQITMVNTLAFGNPKMHLCFAHRHIIPRIMTKAPDILAMARTTDGISGASPVVSMTAMLNVLINLMVSTCELGPVYLNEALDSDILPLLMSTHVLWINHAAHNVDLDRLGGIVCQGIQTIQDHLYHYRAFRHILRAVSNYQQTHKEVTFPYGCPFKKPWSTFLDSFELAHRLFRAAEEKPEKNRCDNNDNCPNQSRQRRIQTCAQCMSLQVCSRVCQRALWKNHRKDCQDTVTQFSFGLGIPPPYLITLDTLLHWLSAVKIFPGIHGSITALEYARNRSKLHPRSLGTNPSHILKLCFNPRPFQVRTLPLAECVNQFFSQRLEQSLQEVREDTKRTKVIVCSDFVAGPYTVTSFAVLDTLKLRT